MYLRITRRSLELRPVPFVFILPVILVVFLQGCASNSVRQDPPAVTISISPTAASVVTTKTQPFTATVTNATNTAVTWQVNGVTGGDSAHGTISASGLYTSPSAVPNPATVTVSAISQADATKSASAAVTITASQNPVAISISPTAASVVTTKTQLFTATVTNATNTAVTWQVNGVTGGDSTRGTISTSGLYTAPSAVPNPATVTVSAISQADATKSASATVAISSAPDTTAPTAPSGLTAVASSTTQIGLAWTASTDNVAVVGYRVERCSGVSCTTFAQITTTTTLSFADSGLTASTSYSYRVLATDAAGNLSAYSNTASATTLTSGGSSVTVSVSPKRGGLVTSQTLSVAATLANDTGNQGVNWSSSGGSFSAPTSTSGTAVTFTAPASAGVVTITATSVADGTKTATATIGVTDLAGVFTYHNDLSRDGTNQKEYALAASNVSTATFGKLFSCAADGAIYGQPLWVSKVSIGGGTHNVIVAATMRDSVYVFDADASPCVTYWSQQLLPSGETWGSNSDVGSSDIFPDIGILGTPVIDPNSKAIYLVTKSKTTSGGTYHQRLHALNLADGSERTNSPVEISSGISFAGTCDGGSTTSFSPKLQNQRPGLALVNGKVYVAWASHGDVGLYHGWLVGFDPTTLGVSSVWNASPNLVVGSNDCKAGIWMSGGAPAADSSNNLYVMTGNGLLDANTGGSNYGDSYVKLGTSSGLTVGDWFAPHDQANLNATDGDVGSGGTALLIDQATGPNPHLLIGAGKNGTFYLLNRDNMGHYSAGGDSAAVQSWTATGRSFSTPAFWNNTMYYFGVVFGSSQPGQAYAFNSSTGQFNTTPTSTTPTGFGFPGATPSISSSGSSNGIVWTIDSNSYGTNDGSSRAAGPAVLHAYDASNIASELWNSTMGTGNTAGNAVKFTVPTIANGKVYIPTRGDDTTLNSPTSRGRIDAYGLLPD